jgi:hypothetical protein
MLVVVQFDDIFTLQTLRQATLLLLLWLAGVGLID